MTEPESNLKCPCCGWVYPAGMEQDCGPVPAHIYVERDPSRMSAAALQSGAVEEERPCPGPDPNGGVDPRDNGLFGDRYLEYR
jgi:hypothetical protein